MASTGTLAIGITGRSTQASTHKPSGRVPIAFASRQGTIRSARTPTGRLITVIYTRSKAAKAATRASRLAVAFSGRVTAARVSRPQSRLPIAFSTRQASASVTLRRPAARLAISVATRGTHGLSTRTSATGRTYVVVAPKAARSSIATRLTQINARPPIHNPHIYAIAQEKLRHYDALTWYGEMTAWILLWSERDFEAGLVERCSRCYIPLGAIADTYKQVPEQKCSNCYGTTFEGGVRAIVYRPGLWDQVRAKQEDAARGHILVQRARINIPSDIEARDNDIAVRADGTRWKLEQPLNQGIVTGFTTTAYWDRTVGMYCECGLLDPDAVAYTINVDLNYLSSHDGWNPLLPFPAQPPDKLNGPLILSGP